MSYSLTLIGPVALAVLVLWGRERVSQRWFSYLAGWVAANGVLVLVAAVPGLWHGEWRAIFLSTTALVAATSAWDSGHWLREHPRVAPHRYYLWWSLFWGALLVISMSQNVAVSWLAIEFSTLASSAAIVEMGDRRALEAAWKYVVIASVGLVLALIGIIFIYASLRAGSLGWAALNYSYLAAHSPATAPVIRLLATIFVVSGFGTKAGLVPFHTWLPDAHSEAPSPVSGLLSGVLLGLTVFTIARFVAAVPTPSSSWLNGGHLLTIFGTLSIVAGALALFVQRDIKRLLAYSSVEQVGLMAVAVGIGTPLAIWAALLQFVLHAVVKSTLFYGAGHLSVAYGTTRLARITGLAQAAPRAAWWWAVGVLALAGLPPLGLAYSEWLILVQLWVQHADALALLVGGALTLTFAALTYHLMHTLWGTRAPARDDRVTAEGTP